MAGTCLIIRKSQSSRQRFDELRSQGETLVREVMGEYFPDIRFSAPDENSWLIHFRKNEEEKFIADEHGWLIYEGTVFALNETFLHQAGTLWRLYRQSRNIQDFANVLDGHYVIKIYDAHSDTYYVVNDFIKNKTQFYRETDDFHCYTSYAYLSALIARPEPDPEAVNEYLWRYYILSERSLLKHTPRMEGASIHSIRNGRRKIKAYWQFPRQYSDATFREQRDTMTRNMQETATLLGSHFRPNVDFTQGQDSRLLVAAMLNRDQSFTTSIFGKADFGEVLATQEMARRHHVSHHIIGLNDDFTSDPLSYLEKSCIYGSAEEPGQQLGRILYMREQQMKLGTALCNGMEGRFYKNGLWDEMYTLNFYRQPKALNIDLLLSLRILSQNYPEQVFSPAFLEVKRNSAAYFRSLIEKRISGMEDSPVSMQVDHFDIHHWLNFAIVSNNTTNSITNSLSPLLFRRNLEDALRVPVKWKFNLSKFQRAVVYQLHPALAAEKTNFAGVNMLPKNAVTYPFFMLRYTWYQSQKMRKKFLRKLGFHPKTHLQEAWDYLPVYKTLYKQIEERGLADYSQMAMRELISLPGWNAARERLKDPASHDLNDYEFMFKIITMDRFYRLANGIHSQCCTLLRK
jgi:hypothetical protein